MMSTKTILGLTFSSMIFVACGGPADEFRAALPGKSDVTVSYPEQTAQSEAGLKHQAIVGEPADFYLNTYYESRKINGFGHFVVTLVETITAYPATTLTENSATWGPFSEDREPNEFQLHVERQDSDTLHYTWALEGRPKSSNDWTGMAGGAFEPSSVPDQGRGWFVVDFEAIRTLDPTEDGAGQIAYAFDKNADGLNVQVLFQAVDAQGNHAQAAYVFGERTTGEGFVMFALPADIHENDEISMPAAEDLVIRTQWTASGAGRADVVATNGDLGEQTVYGAQCWDDTFVSTFELFTLDGTVLAAEGDPETCDLGEAGPANLPEPSDITNPFGPGE